MHTTITKHFGSQEDFITWLLERAKENHDMAERFQTQKKAAELHGYARGIEFAAECLKDSVIGENA